MKYFSIILICFVNTLGAQPLAVNITPENATICKTSSQLLTAMLENPGGNVTYNWSNGGGMGMSATYSGNSLSVGMNKIYVTVTEVGGAGMSVIDSATINVVEPLIPAVLTGVSSICKDSMRQLMASATGGQWSSQNSGIAVVDGQGWIKGKAPGEVTIQYLITGTHCPAVTSTKNITVNAPPTPANISGPTTLCFNVSDTLTATVGGGSWSALDPTVATINVNGIITTVSPGKARFRYTISGNGICTDAVKEHLLEILPLPLNPTVQITNPTTCGGTNGSIKLLASLYNATKYLINYTFNNIPDQDTITPFNNAIEISNLARGVYKINSIKNVDTGCQLDNINESRTLTDPPRPVKPEIAVDKLSSCGPATFNFSTPQILGFTYSWKLDGNPQFPSTSVYNPNLSTVKKYVISLTQTQTSTNCISDISTKEVEVFTPVNATIAGKTEVCEGYDEFISAMASTGSGEYTYKWSTGETTAIKDLKTLADGFYSFKVTITDKNNCSNEATKDVVVNDVPEVKLKVELVNGIYTIDLLNQMPSLKKFRYTITKISTSQNVMPSESINSALQYGFEKGQSYKIILSFTTDKDCIGESQVLNYSATNKECKDYLVSLIIDNKDVAFNAFDPNLVFCEDSIFNITLVGDEPGIESGKVLINGVSYDLGILDSKFNKTINDIKVKSNSVSYINLNLVFRILDEGNFIDLPCDYRIRINNDFKPEIILDVINFCFSDTVNVQVKEKSAKKTNFILDKDGKYYKLPDILEIPLKIEKNESAATSFTLKSIKAENNICPAFDKTYTINIKKSPVIPATTVPVCNSIDYKTNVFYEAGVDYKWSYKGNSVSLPFTGSTLESDKYNVTATLTYGSLICESVASISFEKDQPAIGKIQTPGDCSPFFTINTSDILNNTTLTWLYNNSTSNITFPFSNDKRIVSLSSMQAGGKLLLKLQRGTCEHKDSISGSENFNYEEDLRDVETFNCGDGQIYLIPDVDNDCYNWYTYDSTSLELMKVNEIEDVPFVAVDKNLKILVTAVDCNDNCSGTIFNRIKEGEKDCDDKTTATTNYKVYPVPTLDKITIERIQNSWGAEIARLCDLTGRTVKRIKLDDQNSEKSEIDVSDIQPGLYFLNIGEVNYRVIINR